MTGIEALANGACAKIPKKPLQLIGAESGIDFALIHIDADFGGITARDDGVEIGRELNRRANFLVDDLLGVIGSCGHDLQLRERAQGGHNSRRVFSSDHHDRRHLQQRPADQPRRQRSHEDRQHRHQEDRHDDHGNDRATIAERVGELLAIDDGNIAQIHPPTTRIKISSRSARP